MDSLTLAPCGVVCELCIAYQRPRNKCIGCNSLGNKPRHCISCSIKNCEEKSNPQELCIVCKKFPCRRLKDLEKRYTAKYNESISENMQIAVKKGFNEFEKYIRKIWTCLHCGNLLSVHRESCVVCGTPNSNYPDSIN